MQFALLENYAEMIEKKRILQVFIDLITNNFNKNSMGAYTKKNNPKRGVQLTEHSSLCLATLTAGCAEAGLFFFPFLYVRSNTETKSLL